MKNLVIILLLPLFFACKSDDDTNTNNPDGGEITGESSYNPDLVPPPANPLPNLLKNASFESDDAWIVCGDAKIQELPDAKEGQRVVKLSNTSICDQADQPFFTNRTAILIQTLDIQELPELLTVSFWIKSDTTIPEDALRLFITNEPDSFFNSLAGGDSLVKYFSEESINNEWSRIKMYYQKEDNPLFISNQGTLSVVFQLEPSKSYNENITIYLDQIKVSDGTESFTQPDKMPEGLVNYQGDSKILFLNTTSDAVSSMNPNGSNVINHTQIPTEFLVGIPQWLDNDQITVQQKTFNPANPSSTNIIPASGTDVFKYTINSDQNEMIYQTVGDPGFFRVPNDPENKEAIDIEVRRNAWDTSRNRGALTICGRSRLDLFTSDDICNIVIVDTNNFEEIAKIEKGFNPVWSSTGRLAYYYENSIFVATINGNDVTVTKVYENTSISGLLQEVDWSPDGKEILFAEKGNGANINNGELSTFYTIKTLNTETNKVTPLLAIDHGQLRTNLSWSPDGNYILYSLTKNSEKTEIWWFEVSSKKTGPLTNTINAFSGYWKK
ncbi:PD40 domain-containing protein [Aquimarina algicola]|uniref:WD40 repeat domain-containing protein n=1 Tax=Aquimarina algicola TaxID=2589995 RepID=A0A504J2C9_9FLAO|nr:PD40 domain-containing protein [Aquimarina algicola]TPN81229.1 hypothetical protein FHK87_24915 [Aquimarina algicola]